jgi:hypothetical protein
MMEDSPLPTQQRHELGDYLWGDLQKIDQVLTEPHRDVIVVLNLTGVPQPNLINEPPQVGNATEEGFGTAGIRLLSHCYLSPAL